MAFITRNSFLLLLLSLLTSLPLDCWALSSNNIPLDSPVYLYLEKLAGFGLLNSDIKGLKPYSKAEVARLVTEAESNLAGQQNENSELAGDFLKRLRELLPREIAVRSAREAGIVDVNPVSYARARYVYLDGIPRDYNRDVLDPAHQSAFGFIGGDLRPLAPGIVHTSGTEGTPLLENNEGVIYRRGSNADVRWAMEGHAIDKVSLLIEPKLLITPVSTSFDLQKAYLKVGGGGLELEVGRDTNWFGPGFRGTTTLTDNAKNFDMVKLSSPEPLDVGWVKDYLGNLKYSLILSRFDETGSGQDLRHPYFLGVKIALKPKPWCEIGANFVRQMGGPGFAGSPDTFLGGGKNDHSNTIAGIDLLFRIPWLRDTEIYGEYSGEDNAGGVWPFVESYVAGFFVPRLTDSGRDDLRFEYFWGSEMLYGDWQFPAGYVYHYMTPGHSQGTAAQDFFVRYSHWFSVRNSLALEYFYTERGKVGRLTVNASGRSDPNGVKQSVEKKNAVRLAWNVPFGILDLGLKYGVERIHNLNLVGGVQRTNQLAMIDFAYRY